MPTPTVILFAGVIVTAGALVQGGAGFGLGVVAAPTLTLLDPSLMPGALLVAASVLPMLIFAREPGHTDWRGLSWAFAGRLAGTAAGTAVVAVLSVRALGAMVGVIVLMAVVLTAMRSRIAKNPGTLLSAGFVSGATGTASAIGGPPIALLYQRETGPRIRATLAVFFCIGSVISLAALAGAGHLPGRAVAAGAGLIPFVAAGFGLSAPLRKYLDNGRMRAAVLMLATFSAVVLIIRDVL
ncbi:MAG: sulfite exporter TauE/SafE family protein [Micromonosporaceae bacterium]